MLSWVRASTPCAATLFVILLDTCQEFFYTEISSSTDPSCICRHPIYTPSYDPVGIRAIGSLHVQGQRSASDRADDIRAAVKLGAVGHK